MGVYFERPFLAGMAFIAWEAIDVPYTFAGALANAFLIPWMQNLSIAFHVINAFRGWFGTGGFQLVPQGDGLRAFLLLAGGGVALLVAAAYVMRRKEFDL